MKTRKKLISILCAAALLVSALPAAAATAETSCIDCGVEGSVTATEVYIKPIQIDESTYHYYDEDGELLAIFIADSEEDQAVSPRATRYNISWNIGANSAKHSPVELDTTNGPTNVYCSVTPVYSTKSYIGYYKSIVDKYTWFEPPFSSTKSGSFQCASSHPINFAIKNAGNIANTYGGAFSLSPL